MIHKKIVDFVNQHTEHIIRQDLEVRRFVHGSSGEDIKIGHVPNAPIRRLRAPMTRFMGCVSNAIELTECCVYLCIDRVRIVERNTAPYDMFKLLLGANETAPEDMVPVGKTPHDNDYAEAIFKLGSLRVEVEKLRTAIEDLRKDIHDER